MSGRGNACYREKRIMAKRKNNKNKKKSGKMVKNGQVIEVAANKKTSKAATKLAAGMAKTRKKTKKNDEKAVVAEASTTEISVPKVSVSGVKIWEAQVMDDGKKEWREVKTATRNHVGDQKADNIEEEWREPDKDEELIEEARIREFQSPLPEIKRRRFHFSWIRALLAVILIFGVALVGFEVGSLTAKIVENITEEKSGEMLEKGVMAERMTKRIGLLEGTSAGDEIKKKRYAENLANSGKKLVALTFDDGPSYATTGRLLDILKSKNVKATFFVVGSMVQEAPDLVQREAAEGHEVGSHTMNHTNLSLLDATATKAEMVAMDELFVNVLGRPVAIMRPPYGNFTDVTKATVGMPMIYWTVDTLDWKYRNPETVRQNVQAAVFDGAIILMHDIHSTTVDAIAGVIDDLRAQGYEFLTVTELARARGVTLENVGVYGSFRP